MAVTVLDQQTAEAFILDAESTVNGSETNTSFFGFFGITGCRLHCLLHQDYQSQSHTNKQLPRRERAAAQREYDESRSEWFTAAEIAYSALQGCGSCRALGSILQYAFFPDGKLSDDFQYSYTHDLELRKRSLNGKEESREVAQLFQPRGAKVQLKHLLNSNFLSGTRTSMLRLRGWIDHCIENHESCQTAGNAQDGNSRPTRLLDLEPITRSSKARTKLILTEPGVSYQYACLSHRWDQLVEACQTTEENVDRHLDFVPDEKLPANFTDAISITRDLGLRYLWIDSLCIVQDGQDKSKEIAKMGNIYLNAYLTIAAVSSSTSSGGCLRRNIASDVPILLCNANESRLIGIRILDKKGRPPTKKDIPYRYPLLQRAWVFQERLLSLRFLQCNYGEFTYECPGQSVCECDSSLAPHPAERIKSKKEFIYRWRNAMQIPFKSHKLHGNENHPNDRKETALKDWRFIIAAYMYLQITKRGDVLPAISGCAQVFASRFQLPCESYVAGMWKERLSSDLLWYVRPLVEKVTQKSQLSSQHELSTDRPKKRPTKSARAQPARAQPRPDTLDRKKEDQTTAPSWSWASVAMGQAIDVFSTEKKRHPLLDDTIKEIHCEPRLKENPFGQLKYAYLRLNTVLYPWYLRAYCHHAVREIARERRRAMMDLHLVRREQQRHRSDSDAICTSSIPALEFMDGENVQLFFDAPIIRGEMETEEFGYCARRSTKFYCWLAKVYLLPALQQTESEKLIDVFLLLVKTVGFDDRSNCYMRIGLLVVDRRGKGARTWEEMIEGVIEPQSENIWLV